MFSPFKTAQIDKLGVDFLDEKFKLLKKDKTLTNQDAIDYLNQEYLLLSDEKKNTKPEDLKKINDKLDMITERTKEFSMISFMEGVLKQ